LTSLPRNSEAFDNYLFTYRITLYYVNNIEITMNIRRRKKLRYL